MPRWFHTHLDRILEFEREVSKSQSRSFDKIGVSVELWDVSGDQQYVAFYLGCCESMLSYIKIQPRYEACWPAIMKNTNGVIIVYNPDNRQQDQEVGLWCAKQ